MPEVTDLSCCKGAFVRTKLEFRVPETLEDLAEAGEVLLPVETGEDVIHESREGGRPIAEAKGYLVELEELTTAGAEGRLLFISFLNRNLPIPTLERTSGLRGVCRGGRQCEKWDARPSRLQR